VELILAFNPKLAITETKSAAFYPNKQSVPTINQ
jgi:hypothetical protein